MLSVNQLSNQEDVSEGLRRQAATLATLSDAIVQWDTIAAEAGGASAAAECLSRALEFTRRARDLFCKLLEVQPAGPRGHSSVEILMAGTGTYSEQVRSMAANGGSTLLSDLAFVAKLETGEMASAMRRIAPDAPASLVLDVCQRVRRRLLKALIALGRVLRQRLRIDAIDEVFVSELAGSLACRRILARLWARVEQTDGLDLNRRLRLAGTAIAMLQGRDAYYGLRISDRWTLHALHQRVLAWAAARHSNERAGAALLLDLVGFVSLSRRVNCRAELVEHDRFAVPRCLAQLQALQEGDPDGRRALLDSLEALRGLSAHLDLQLSAVGDASLAGVHFALADAMPDGPVPRATDLSATPVELALALERSRSDP